jgi:hypothetical protein
MAAENKILNNATVKIGNAQSEEHRLIVYHSDNTSVSIYGYGLYMNRTASYIRPSNDKSQDLYMGADGKTWRYVKFDAENVTFGKDNSEYMRIDTNGNVGIGTTDPKTILEVSNASPEIGFLDTGANDRGSIHFQDGKFEFYTNTTTAGKPSANGSQVLTILKNGNVGIGETSPSNRLHIKHNSNAATGILVENSLDNDGTNDSDAAAQISFQVASNNGYLRVHGSPTDVASEHQIDLGSTASGSFLTFSPSGSEKVRIDSSGNVGIGTTSPSSKLHVNIPGNTVAFRASRNDGTDGDLEISFGSALTAYNSKAGGHRWLENGSEKMRLTGGNVGIGTTSPSYKLHVSGDAGVTGTLYSNDIEVDGGNQIVVNNSSAGHITIGGIQNESENGYLRGNIRFSRDDDQITYDNVNNVFEHAGGSSTDWSMIGHHSDGMRIYSGSSDSTGWSKNYATFKDDHMSIYINNTGAIQLGQYGAGLLTSDSSGNITVDTTTYIPTTDYDDFVNVAGDTMTGQLVIQKTGNFTAAKFKGTAADGYGQITVENDLGTALILGSMGSTKTGTFFDNARYIGATSGELVLKTYSSTDGHMKFLSGGQNERMRITAGGNVGIGTTSPLQTLDLDGVAYFRGGTAADFGVGDTPTNTAIIIEEGDYIYTRDNNNLRKLIGKSSSDIIEIGQSGTSLIDEIRLMPGTSNGIVSFYNDNSEYARFKSGNLGIGTTGPDDNINTGSYFKPDSGGRFLTLKDSSGSFIMLESSTTTDDDQIGGIYFNNTGGQADAHVHVAGIDALLYKHPTNDALSGGDLRFFTKPSGSGINTPRMIILQNGNVGIGTSGPNQLLHTVGGTVKVESDGGNASGAILELKHANNNTTDVCATINFTNNVGGYAAIEGGTTGANNTGYLAFKTDNAGTQGEAVRILGNGNVGIGTTSPSYPLEVNGSIQADKLYIGGNFADEAGINIGTSQDLTFVHSTYQNDYKTRFENVDVGGGVCYLDWQVWSNTYNSWNSAIRVFSTDSSATHQSVKISNAFTLPNSDGSSGQVMTTNGSGTLSWSNVTTSDTLDDVTDNGNSTTNSITVGGLTSTGSGEMQGGDLYFKNGGDDGAGTHLGNVWYSVSTGGGAAPVGVYESAVITTVKNGTHGRSDLVFKTKNNDTANFGSANERMRITKNGLVGINETSPHAYLHIDGSSYPQLLLDGGSDTTGDIVVPSGEKLQIGHWNNGTSTYTPGITMNSASQVALSNNTPASLLHLGKDTNGSNIISFGEASTGGPHGLDFYGDDATRTLKYSIYYRTGTENISMETSDGTKRFEINQSGAVTLNEAFTFPTADGSTGAALVTNGSGSLSWNAGYQQYTPVGWGILNNQTYTSTGSNISSNSVQAQSGTTPVQRNSATEFEATKAGWYEISYSFIVKNNYTNRAMIGAYMTVSTSGGGGVISGSHSTQYVRYSTYGQYAQIQNTFYYYTSASSTNFYLLAYLLSGSMNMTTQAVSQSMISFRYINNDIT